MAMTQHFKSTLTDRYQTTVPDAVRRVLKPGKRDKIRYVLQPDGAVVMERADSEDRQSVLGDLPPRDAPLADELIASAQRAHKGIDAALDAIEASEARLLALEAQAAQQASGAR